MYQSRRAGDEAKKGKSVSLPPKAGELASLIKGRTAPASQPPPPPYRHTHTHARMQIATEC